MSTSAQWQQGFARQSAADFTMWSRLQTAKDVPECHKLHFLQMACEKLSKAHLCQAGADPYSLQASHAYIAKQLPIVVKEQMRRLTGRDLRKFNPRMKQVKLLCREIELLAPSVDDGGRRPDNCEYPWELSDGMLRVPTEHNFPGLSLLRGPVGQTLLKCVNEAIAGLV